MLPCILNLSNEIDSSIFLFGARRTGKSTILVGQADAIARRSFDGPSATIL